MSLCYHDPSRLRFNFCSVFQCIPKNLMLCRPSPSTNQHKLIEAMVNTRSTQYGQDVKPSSAAAPLETLTERRLRWSRLLREQYYQPIISEVLQEELPKYASSICIDPTDHIRHMRECALVLASAPKVFAAAVDGNLVERLLNDTNLRTQYAAISERANHQPSIYIHLLADERGIPPTPNQYLAIRGMVLDYLTDGQVSGYAWQLDNVTPPSVSKSASAKGVRKYLHTNHRSSTRVKTFYRFCEGVQRRWEETPVSLRDIPFQFPPGECGYSKDSHTRMAMHRMHRSSNYVMNLVEDICTFLYRSGYFHQHFRMHQFIIYLIFRPKQAAIAEIFCSGLLQVWVDNGGGFNAYPAELSVATAQRVSLTQWSEHESWVRERSPIKENMEIQRVRAEEWRKALDWEPADHNKTDETPKDNMGAIEYELT
ncbi:hypothetical protein GQ44DRAFT_709959 [Phaeosphaeriaceae sp. PMI808]|nr:hypothetical protein GQ44DRAFT_709959 [Phaeosphaeriaceae sp. PMI808]